MTNETGDRQEQTQEGRLNEVTASRKSKSLTERGTSFETSFSRLEQILELMNSGTVSLDESITLFEEANRLLGSCNKQLTDAEKRIETLIKSRNGDLVLGADQKPMVREGFKG